MDLLNIHNDLLFLANKERNFWPRADIDAALHRASIDAFNLYYPRYSKDQDAIDALATFKKKITFTEQTTTAGIIDLSKKEYQHLLSMYVVNYNNQRQQQEPQEVIIIPEDELAKRLKSQMEPVTKQTPIATVSEKGVIQLYPEVPNNGHLFYLKTPTAPKFEASYEGRKENYNQSNSEQLEWADAYIPMIITGALQILGINIESERLKQYTQSKIG